MIDLQDAIERAKMMAGEDSLLNQQAYDTLIDKIEEEDVYPFTMALSERGILVKTSTLEKPAITKESIVDKLLRQAQQYSQSPGGVWMPSSYDEDEEYELDESDLEELDQGEDYYELPSDEYELGQEDTVEQLRETLESAGLRVTPDGKVEMWQSQLPGIYTTKLPQGPLPLDIAVKYFDQMLDSTEGEQGRLDELLDLLTRLSSQTYEIEMSVEDLTEYAFSPMSTSDNTRAISEGIEQVKLQVAEGNWNGAQATLDGLRDTIAAYDQERGSVYDTHLSVVDALDRLAEMRDFNPEVYKQVVKGLGAMARRKISAVDTLRDFYAGESDPIVAADYADVDFNRLYVRDSLLSMEADLVREEGDIYAFTAPIEQIMADPLLLPFLESAVRRSFPKDNISVEVSCEGHGAGEPFVGYFYAYGVETSGTLYSPPDVDDEKEFIFEDYISKEVMDTALTEEFGWSALSDKYMDP